MTSHDGGYEWPAAEPVASVALSALIPSVRLRLRLRSRNERETQVGRDGRYVVQLCFQCMLDGAHALQSRLAPTRATPGSAAAPWVKRDLTLSDVGIELAA